MENYSQYLENLAQINRAFFPEFTYCNQAVCETCGEHVDERNENNDCAKCASYECFYSSFADWTKDDIKKHDTAIVIYYHKLGMAMCCTDLKSYFKGEELNITEYHSFLADYEPIDSGNLIPDADVFIVDIK